MAKAKAKAAVKSKPAKAPSRAAAATKSAAPKPVKASTAKTKAVKATAKAAVVKPAAAKAAAAKTAPAKPVAFKPETSKAPLEKIAAVSKTTDIKSTTAPVVPSAPRSTQQLSLPAAKAAEAAVAVAKPQPIVRKATEIARADLPPPDGFTLLVDGHFKNSFGDLKGAKAAASELKGRFPMLRVEIYDAAKKARLPA